MIKSKIRTVSALLSATTKGYCINTSWLQHRRHTSAGLQIKHILTHTWSAKTQKSTHRASWRSVGLEALISSEQTPQVMAMFSGCYLVFCGNEIVGYLIATLRLWRPPWPLLGTRTTGLPGDSNQPTGCLEIKRLPESSASGMIGRILEADSCLRTFTPRREATFCLEGWFRQGARVLRKMRRFMWCHIKSDKWLEEKSLEK